MARAVKTRAVKSSTKKVVKKAPPKAKTLHVVKTKAAAPKKEAVKAASKVAPAVPALKPRTIDLTQPDKKPVSQRLIETIERRKLEREQGREAIFAKKPGRRGRKPKNVEYTPGENQEESYGLEAEVERLEYDTGISVKSGSDDGSMVFDRAEDFDEELNFDW